jgi:hypothetical protein
VQELYLNDFSTPRHSIYIFVTTKSRRLPYTPPELERKYERADSSMNRGLFLKEFAPARTTKIFEFSLAKLKGTIFGEACPLFSCQLSVFSLQPSSLQLSVFKL